MVAQPDMVFADVSSRARYQSGRGFKLPTDLFFVEKVRDIVGLYLNPPDHARVLCVDEKSQIQALNRTQPVLLHAPNARPLA